ncbi:MAG: V-type ATP synthase subunit F [Peptoniphilaceae bacterium]|nr:V-type ATP synthase subunit F [Peptoniphilaceae bacterium]MDY6086271.1 V-type ATP synthase subunit F [Peptoniphilaceae bacterium]
MHKVAVIGDRASVLAFRALGCDVFTPTEEHDIRRTVDRLAQEDYAVIFMTEELASRAMETVERYKAAAVPAIIMIPNSRGSKGIGMAEISKNVEKAVGMDIF